MDGPHPTNCSSFGNDIQKVFNDAIGLVIGQESSGAGVAILGGWRFPEGPLLGFETTAGCGHSRGGGVWVGRETI